MGNAKNATTRESDSKDPRKVRYGNRAYWRSEGKEGESETRDAPTVDKGKYVKKGLLMFADKVAQAGSLVPGLGLPVAIGSAAYQAFAPEGSEFHSKGPLWKKALGLGAGVLGGVLINKAVGAIAKSDMARKLGTQALKTIGRGQTAVHSVAPSAHPLGPLGNLPVGPKPTPQQIASGGDVVFSFPDPVAPARTGAVTRLPPSTRAALRL